MSKKVYRFNPELERGEYGEKIVDGYYSRRCEVEKATKAEQFKGIDSKYTSKKTGELWTVQIKTDFKSQIYGNLVFETISKVETNSPGWVHTCQADVLIYFRFYVAEIIGLMPDRIRRVLPDWKLHYREVPIKNEKWTTYGLLVPVDHVQRLAWWKTIIPCDYLQED